MSPKPEEDAASSDGGQDLDRERILARRAVFVTTALAALSCSPATQQQSPGPDASVTAATTEPTSTTAPTTSATATAVPAGPSSLRDWKDVIVEAPPLEVAASLPTADKDDLQKLRERLAPGYDALGAAWKGVPTSCAPKDCKAQWAAAADAIHQLRDSVKPGLCGEWGGLGYRQRLDEHRAFIQKITSEIETGLTDAAMKLGDATTWPQMVVLPPQPHPCLKCAMPQDPGVMEGGDPLAITFADGASTLGPDAEAALAKIPAEVKDIIIRGHADPGEKDAPKLAQARADAVKKALAKKGHKAKITTVVLGADLPIASSKTEEGRAKNRRVDFGYPPAPKR